MANPNEVPNQAPVPASQPAHSVQVGIQLQPVDHSDQPIFANFTAVQGAPGMVFLDFGFLEPQAISGLARLARSGSAVPEAIRGRLACRVALSPDTVANLAQQLNQLLRPAAAHEHAAPRPHLPEVVPEASVSDTSLH